MTSRGLSVALATIAVVFSTFLALANNHAGSPQASASGTVEWIDTHVNLVAGMRRNFSAALQEALAAMDEVGIRMAVIMPTPQTSSAPAHYDYDDFVSAVKKYPARFAFMGGSSLNRIIHDTGHESKPDKDLRYKFEKKANEIITQGGVGFGEMGAQHLSLTQGHPYSSVPAHHPLFLLLADITARHEAVIDLHFDMVAEDMPLPDPLASPPNPPTLHANLAAFERLLAHNRKAKIVWAHAGSDQLGHWTVDVSRKLLQRHPNLYMSLRLMPGRAPWNHPLTPAMEIKPPWLRLLQDFPDRFVIGGDQFFTAPKVGGSGPGFFFSQRAPVSRKRTMAFLSLLPQDLARKIGYENAIRLYKLEPS